MLPIDLIFAHRYEKALGIYEETLKNEPSANAAIGGRAIALQCLGRYAEALEEFKRANANEAARGTGSQPELQTIGGLQWLLGEREDAIQTFKSGMNGILDGSLQFSDGAGGVSHGLLMWYAGVSVQDRGAQDYAYNYLRRLGKSARTTRVWPGHLAHFALGKMTRDEVLNAACGASSISGAIKIAKADLLKRRQLVQALFYFATKERAEGREEECLSLMKQCADLENPIIEIEWFLARGEIK